MSTSRFKKLYDSTKQSPAEKLLSVVRATLSQGGVADIRAAGAIALARENQSDVSMHALNNTVGSMTDNLKRNLAAAQLSLSDYTINCAVESGVLASQAKLALQTKFHTAPTGGNYTGVEMMGDAVDRGFAAEAYSEENNSTVMENTMTYQLLSGRQAPAAELLFPTVVVPSDNSGISVTIRLYELLEDKRRTIDAESVNFGRTNLIDTMIDHTLLRNDGTLAIPFYRPENVGVFAAGATPSTKVFERRSIPTAPLAFGKKINLVQVSADDALMATGAMNREDGLDQDVKLGTVYLKVGDDILPFDVSGHADANFIYVGQGNYREQRLNFSTESLFLTKSTVAWTGAAPANAALAQVVAGTHRVALGGRFFGDVNIEEGDAQVDMTPKVTVVGIYTGEGEATLNVTNDPGVEDLKEALEAATWFGWTPEARRANKNLRERGDIVNINFETQRWAVPTRSPVTALRPPVESDTNQDAAVLEILAAQTFARTTGAAYETLLQTVNILRSISQMPTTHGKYPEVLGVGRYVVRPVLIEEEMDASANVASLRSADLEDDISATMVNRSRDMVYRLYRDSRLQAVVESGAAGTTEQPTVLAITDPLTARYLCVKGDIRTLGPDFKLVVRATPNKFIAGKIFLAFGYPEDNRENSLNPLHFGAHLWGGEVAFVMPISRSNGSTSRELTVFPRFRHIVNVPILGVLTVKNLSAVVAKRVPVDFKQL